MSRARRAIVGTAVAVSLFGLRLGLLGVALVLQRLVGGARVTDPPRPPR